MLKNLQKILFLSVITIGLQGCPWNSKSDLSKQPEQNKSDNNSAMNKFPNVSVLDELPSLAKDKNQSIISGNFVDMDPSWVIGSLLDIENGEVLPLNNIKSDKADPVVKLLGELTFSDFIDNSLIASTNWLTFIKGSVSNDKRTELTVTKLLTVTIKNTDIDDNKLRRFVKNHKDKKSKYGVIIGYIDYGVTAKSFKHSAANTLANGYGANIEGKWYSKTGKDYTDHRLVAMWAPLSLVEDTAGDNNPQVLNEVVQDAIEKKEVIIDKVDSVDTP